MKNIGHRIAPLIWILAYLVVADVAINVIFRYPKDPRNINPTTLQRFFEYGRSVEGKLARMTGKPGGPSARIVASGWLDGSAVRIQSKNAERGARPAVTVYGMSHAVQLAEALGKTDESFFVRSVGAPGAVPTWAYEAYVTDKERFHSDVVILGIMTNGVSLAGTTSGTTNHFDSVWPYTYPRFFLREGKLERRSPPHLSLKEYKEHFYDPKEWEKYVEWLRLNDKYYDPFLFHKTVLDHSSIFRMLRRAYAYSSRRSLTASVYDERLGFRAGSEEIQILQSIVVDFSDTARKNGSLPIVFIVNNLHTSDHLYRALEPTLTSQSILFLSTHKLCPPNDPRYYLPDSHFLPKKNMELAKGIMRIIRENMPALAEPGDNEGLQDSRHDPSRQEAETPASRAGKSG